MPVSKLADLPAGGGGRWPLCGMGGFTSVHWGDLEIGHTVLSAPTSSEGHYDALPGGLCPCPHYGYVFKGSVRCVYPGSDFPDEVAEEGDVYFFRTGHYLVYEADSTEILEWNPADALAFLMDHIEEHAQRVVAALQAEAEAEG